MSELKKLPRTAMRLWVKKHLRDVQLGLCPLCGKPIDLSITGEGVVDHDHDTGEVRGVLHRSCNAAEGKTANAVGHWGAKSMRYADIIPFAEALVRYWKQPGAGVIYPFHLTEDEKRVKANSKRALAAAKRKAAVAERKLRSQNGNS